MKKTIKFVGILMFIFFLTGCKDHAHELIHINPKEATCMEEGIVEHWKCKTCEKCFLDEQGKTEMKDITIKKLVHNFDMNNIKWEWSEDNEEAVAILTCENGETHQERIQAVVTNEETIEAITYTATITYNNVTYTYTNTKQNLFSLAYELSQDKTSYIVTGRGTYKGTNIAIPSEYNGLPVISIGDNTFAGCSSLTSITLPDSVTSIGERAFYKCSSLTSITLPNNVTNIGSGAFWGCRSLTNIAIPSSVTCIGEGAFFHCSGLLNIIVDENNPIYDSRENCNAIIEKETNTLVVGCQNTMIPNSVSCIGKQAFMGCLSLTNIAIPSNVTRIEIAAFGGCSGLTSITIPNSITSIEDNTFWGCNNLTNIILGDSITHIGDYAFANCKGLTSIILPSSVTRIGRCAFGGCHNLISINIPNSVTCIGDRAFEVCDNLQYNEYENGYYLGSEENPYIVFIKVKDTSITNAVVHNNTKFISSEAFAGCFNLKSIALSNSLISVGDRAFGNCGSLTSIVIPNSVTWISRRAFINCTNLTSVTFVNTSGWSITKNSSVTSGSSIDVTNATTNARNLTSYYKDYYWKRS